LAEQFPQAAAELAENWGGLGDGERQSAGQDQAGTTLVEQGEKEQPLEEANRLLQSEEEKERRVEDWRTDREEETVRGREKDLEGPSPRVKEEWVTKRDNPWDTKDKEWLKAQLEAPRTEQIGGRCVLKHHIKVWEETCGGAEFMKGAMRPYWRDADSPERLQKLTLVYYRPLNEREETAGQKMLKEEMDEGIVIKIEKEKVRFLNPTFLVPKSNRKWRKVVDARR
jgi:hypothetical protein